jgi:HAD superfamily hydrolase (TIGR01509 family)
MSRQPLRALLLDFDGTIADSIPTLFKLYKEFLAQRGATGTIEEFQLLNGLSLPEVIKHVCVRHGLRESHEKLGESYVKQLHEIYAQQIEPFAGLVEFLHTVQRSHLQVAIVSSAARGLIQTFLKRHGLAALINQIVTAEGLSRGKPDPAIYCRGLEAVGVASEEAIAVEDSLNGIHSSVGAKIPTIALTHRANLPPLSVELLAQVADWSKVLEIVQRAIDASECRSTSCHG